MIPKKNLEEVRAAKAVSPLPSSCVRTGTPTGRWHALVLFVDAHRWPDGKKVYLNGQERDVSLELYEAMKHDPALQPFP